MKVDAIAITERDNVATALRDIKDNEVVIVTTGDKRDKVRIIEKILFGHKFALCDISIGDKIIKYGEVIGRATKFVPMGTHAHIHNIESLRGRGDLQKEAI